MTGKILPFYLVSVSQGCLLLGMGRILFGMPLGSHPWTIVPVLLMTSAAATTLGFWVATLVKGETQVSSLSTLLVIGMAGLSGCLMPRAWMPEIMQQVSLYVSPMSWSLIGYAEALGAREPDIARLAEVCGALLGFSLLFLILAVWRFRSLPRIAMEAP
jgi:ABC-2 type transport system permease protein